MKNADVLRDFGGRIGLPNLQFSSDGAVGVVVGDNLEIRIEGDADGESLDLIGVIGPLPSNSNRFLIALLTANHSGVATDGGAVAIDPRTTALTYCKRIDTSAATGDSFLCDMQQFVKYLAFWVNYVPGIATAYSGERRAEPFTESTMRI